MWITSIGPTHARSLTYCLRRARPAGSPLLRLHLSGTAAVVEYEGCGAQRRYLNELARRILEAVSREQRAESNSG